jgi:TolB-like protein/Flp pilus assembly protein TadD
MHGLAAGGCGMRFRFGDHLLDPERRELHRGGELIALEPRVFDLLVHLVRNRDHVVSKDELIAHVWRGRIVSDSAIDRQVKAARQAVGDSGATQILIRTMPRKGVRFIADAWEEQDARAMGSAPDPAPLARPDKPSIAVLAFNNLSSDPEQEYFSDGIAEDITTALSRYRSLFVIARNSSFTFKGRAVDVTAVAYELNVRYVVEGSVRRIGDAVRISAQLIDTETASHVWADRYDCKISDLFAVQDEITNAVVLAIEPAIGQAEIRRAIRQPPGSLAAWETYQRGLWHVWKGTAADNAEARRLFQRAAAMDPGFASPLVAAALTHIWDALFYGMSLWDIGPIAVAEARKAVAIDPDDPEAQAALGLAYTTTSAMESALECADRAVTLNRNCAAAHYLRGAVLTFTERCAEGREEALTSLRLNPRDRLSPQAASVVVASHFLERDYAAAVTVARRYIVAFPTHRGPRRVLVAALGQLGRQDEARTALRELLANPTGLPEMYLHYRPPFVRPEDHQHFLDGLRKAGWAE